ncbi:MAG TPA: lysophospholipid acyltransferase family protein [Candidatus Limnocylindria bacterium]|nr:lysophospholipid acyltransferase family protein [Candidatus Limnocylindria bacterium]
MVKRAARAGCSLLFWGFIAVSSLVLFPVALLLWLVTAPFDRRLVWQHRFTSWWASLYTRLNPLWRVTVEGAERIDPAATYVMISNHQSFVDILVLFRLRAHYKWVSKAEMFRIPCIGWNMRLNRYVELLRGDAASIARMMAACEAHLAAGSSVLLFPEGTRSLDGRLKPFKHGAFTLARRAGVPILPIVIEGTAHALPKHGFVLRGRHAIRVRILDPVPASALADRPVEAVVEEFEALYARVLGEEPPRARLTAAAAAPQPARTPAAARSAPPAG